MHLFLEKFAYLEIYTTTGREKFQVCSWGNLTSGSGSGSSGSQTLKKPLPSASWLGNLTSGSGGSLGGSHPHSATQRHRDKVRAKRVKIF